MRDGRVMSAERAIVFDCEGSRLVGVLHESSAPATRGVLIVVGGPQYRVGSHRQFLLLGRSLAARGIPVLRFDYRGMGDSDGPAVSFEETGPDIRSAIDELFRRTAGLREVIIWGLCDAASAALLHVSSDRRVAGLVLLNPWVRQPHTEAKTHLRHYYLARMLDVAQLKRLVTGRIDVIKSVRDFWRTARTSIGGLSSSQEDSSAAGGSFVTRMLRGLEGFHGKSLLILSGGDMTAAEFKDEAARSRRWSDVLARSSVTRHDLAEANHTFSKAEWRNVVADRTMRWVESL
jgi:uncharacterized protein